MEVGVGGKEMIVVQLTAADNSLDQAQVIAYGLDDGAIEYG